MTRVLHVFGQMKRGGAELRTIEVMRRMCDSDIEFHFCALSGLPGEFDDEIYSLGGYVHLVSYRDWRFPYYFSRLLHRHHIDVVHSHVFYVSGFIVWLARIAGVRQRIVHFRSSQDGVRLSWFRRIRNWMLKGMINQYATAILGVSASALAQAWRSDWSQDDRCQVIYNGLDMSPFRHEHSVRKELLTELQLDVDTRLLIHVGRLTLAKNHLRLLQIFAELIERLDNMAVHLLLIGELDDHIYPATLKLIHTLNLTKKVSFLGRRTDVPELLFAADMMLFPSLYEGLPGAVLEACATGLPILASDIPVIKEIADYLPTLQYLSLEKSDSEWAATITNILNREKSGQRSTAQAAFEKTPFSLEMSVRLYEALWVR